MTRQTAGTRNSKNSKLGEKLDPRDDHLAGWDGGVKVNIFKPTSGGKTEQEAIEWLSG